MIYRTLDKLDFFSYVNGVDHRFTREITDVIFDYATQPEKDGATFTIQDIQEDIRTMTLVEAVGRFMGCLEPEMVVDYTNGELDIEDLAIALEDEINILGTTQAIVAGKRQDVIVMRREKPMRVSRTIYDEVFMGSTQGVLLQLSNHEFVAHHFNERYGFTRQALDMVYRYYSDFVDEIDEDIVSTALYYDLVEYTIDDLLVDFDSVLDSSVQQAWMHNGTFMQGLARKSIEEKTNMTVVGMDEFRVVLGRDV